MVPPPPWACCEQTQLQQRRDYRRVAALPSSHHCPSPCSQILDGQLVHHRIETRGLVVGTQAEKSLIRIRFLHREIKCSAQQSEPMS
eukprot:1941880-Rhodomonas_salina.1